MEPVSFEVDSTPVSFGDLAQFLFLGGFLSALLLVLVNVLFAIGVGRDAAARKDRGAFVAFVVPGAWFLATLVGSFLVVALYWLIHYSSLRSGGETPA